MPVLVDTSIWSLVLRRELHNLSTTQAAARDEMARLIRRYDARIIGPIRQELLSGIRHKAQFERIRTHLRGFADVPLRTLDYEAAAEANNACRAIGIAGSAVDYLLCAIAIRLGWEIYSGDQDFGRYARVLPIRLHQTP